MRKNVRGIMIKVTTVAECMSVGFIENEIVPMLSICQWNFHITKVANDIRKYLSHLEEGLTIIIEDGYVDKVYRDSYYHYYSTKLRNYHRNCLRLSFVATSVDYKNLFSDLNELNKLESGYLGFMVLRPVYPGCVGRTAISPQALKNAKNLLVCLAPIRSTVLGIHTMVQAFPHSSQDAEMMTCAETSIWAMMEYFGNKYPEYTPILPSKILKILENKSDERQIPSHGLTYLNISYALKSQGFGCKVYAKTCSTDYRSIFACYIESGIPVAVALTKPGLGHAVLCVGRTAVARNAIDAVPPQTLSPGISIRRWSDAISEFVFIDDNRPCYQVATFEEPVKHYLPSWHGCEISHFIVPLYKKIYLDAPMAINYANRIIPMFTNLSNDMVSRTFLASNHTYKDYVAKEPNMKPAFKDLILNHLHFSKFVWVTELASYDCFLKNRAEGLILLDATEPLSSTSLPFIFACYKDQNLFFDPKRAKLETLTLSLCTEFESFNRNLQ